MMAPQDTVGSPPAALAAFLRGCERRGAVFAELQCGDPDRGDVALAAALRAFRGNAAALPMADWPVRFWSLLAAAPPLRTAIPEARWPDALSALAAPAPLDRAALLLRLAGGLQEADAADALGLDGAAYRDALARACPRDALGHPDAAAWRAVAEAIQTQLRELPPRPAGQTRPPARGRPGRHPRAGRSAGEGARDQDCRCPAPLAVDPAGRGPAAGRRGRGAVVVARAGAIAGIDADRGARRGRRGLGASA